MTRRSASLLTFNDADGRECSVQEVTVNAITYLRLGKDGHRWLLSRQHVHDLLPVLQAFAEHGTLIEEGTTTFWSATPGTTGHNFEPL